MASSQDAPALRGESRGAVHLCLLQAVVQPFEAVRTVDLEKVQALLGSFESWKKTNPAERAEFYKGSALFKDWPTIEARLTEELTFRAVRFEPECEKGEYLPATIYLANGFAQEHIDGCDDRRDHPWLGKMIRIPI